jgi:MGT family glycosyltransferase
VTPAVHDDDTTHVSHVVFVSWWGGGNMTPVLSLGAEMRRRGHEVTVVGPKQFGSRLALDDITHVPVASWTPAVEEVRTAVDDARPDLLVIDGMMGEVLAAAPSFDGARQTAALVHTMWQPVADEEWDNVSVFCGIDRINDIRRDHGLAEVASGVHLLRDLDHVLAAMPEPLDRPLRTNWQNARYLGPLLEPAGPDEGVTFPGSSPLVVVGLGTTPMEEDDLLRRTLAAIGELGVGRFLVTVGDHLDPAGFPEPPNAVVTRYIRHAAVLPQATAVVSHGGLGTTIAAAAYGLPTLAIPLGRDQPANAARVVELGIGFSLEPTASVAEVAEALLALLASVDLRDRARTIGQEIARSHPDPHGAFAALL